MKRNKAADYCERRFLIAVVNGDARAQTFWARMEYVALCSFGGER
jgi:hypothetical protein